MKLLLTLASVFVFSFGASAAEITASHRAAIEKLLVVSQMQKQMEASIVSSLDGGLGISDDQIKALPEAQQAKMRGAMDKVRAFMVEALSWEKLKEDVTSSHAKNFTEEEAVAVTKLLESETGKLFVSKQVILSVDLAKLTSERMKTVMPQVMQLMQTEMQK